MTLAWHGRRYAQWRWLDRYIGYCSYQGSLKMANLDEQAERVSGETPDVRPSHSAGRSDLLTDR
jgi:hypothetical protein